VLRAIADAEDPEQAARALHSALELHLGSDGDGRK